MARGNGSAYEQVTRTVALDNKRTIEKIEESVKELTNHYSKRLPVWATVVFMLLMGIIGWYAKGGI